MSISWYVNRLRRMSAQEVAQRLRDQVVKTRLRSQMGKPAKLPPKGFAVSFIPFDAATLDLLSVLRRAGPPYQLTTRQLTEQTRVTAGAISQRVARAERSV